VRVVPLEGVVSPRTSKEMGYASFESEVPGRVAEEVLEGEHGGSCRVGWGRVEAFQGEYEERENWPGFEEPWALSF
jgi:hypothetical protein